MYELSMRLVFSLIFARTGILYYKLIKIYQIEWTSVNGDAFWIFSASLDRIADLWQYLWKKSTDGEKDFSAQNYLKSKNQKNFIVTIDKYK